MDWLESAAIEPVLEQGRAASTALAPTNPSSLTLAILGLATLVVFEMGRRALGRRTAAGGRDRAPMSTDQRREAA